MYNETVMTLNDILGEVHKLQLSRDWDALCAWCEDYEEGVIQEITLPLVAPRYHDYVLECLRYEYHKSVDLLEEWDYEDWMNEKCNWID